MKQEKFFSLPTDFRARVRQCFNLDDAALLRIAYVPGPGELRDTYSYWKRGQPYPGKAIITYSEMFFDVVEALSAEALIIERGADRAEEMCADNCTFIRLSDIDYETPGAYWPQKQAITREIARHCEQFKPHILILGGEFYWPMLPRLAKSSERIVMSLHNMFWQIGRRPQSLKNQINFFVKKVLVGRYVDAAVAVSKTALDQFNEISPRKIPGFQSMHQLPSSYADVGEELARRKNQICYLGRIEREKGVFELLEAFCVAKSHQSDLAIRFLGAGRALDELREKAGATGFADDIEAPGPVDAADVYGALRESQLLVVPTQRAFAEGFPAVCAEAISQLTPLLVSSVVPAREVFGDAVMEFEAENSKNLAECLTLLLCDEQKLDDMRKAASDARAMLYDRSKSWGSALAQAIVASAER
ncbi:MAG: glycosyltransferase family 4 protein [Marinicaulis sp.]|nr:glycosyltransferase family 4 protein [Marinicaulis sp.]